MSRAGPERRQGRALPRVPEGLPGLPAGLPQPVVDSHCHLDAAEPVSGLAAEAALELATSVGVTRIVQVGCDVPSSRWAVTAAGRWEAVVASVALHPNDAARLGARLPAALAEIEALAQHDRVRAVGETGLDFFRTPDAAGQAVQRQSFAAHIALAHRQDKTLVIHDRDAHAAVLEVLDSEGVPDRVVMHCFSGDAAFARACIDRGAYLSFAGTVTFKSAEPLRQALRSTPLDRILVETDAPYLTPTPFRGRPNSSYLIPHTVRLMAQVLGRDLEEVCRALNDNADAAFGGVWG